MEAALIQFSLLLFLSILTSKISSRLGVPAILFFLAIGMLAGSQGLGGIHFDSPQMIQTLGSIALSFILFSGGVSTDFSNVRPILWSGLILSTLGVFFSAVLIAGIAMLVLQFSWYQGLLLGAIVSSTDAAAVFTILRSKHLKLRGHLQGLIEFESGSNDPMAVFLTLAMIRLITDGQVSLFDLTQMFLLQMFVGGVLGYVIARFFIFLINKIALDFEGLYSALTISMVLFTYSLSTLLAGNGFLAVYVAALTMGNSDFANKKNLLHFHDGLAWLMQIVMFLALGLQVIPMRLIPLTNVALTLSFFLIFLARPLSVFAVLIFSRFTIKEKVLISWSGLRGSVPIILATFPFLYGVPNAEVYFNIVFFIVVTSSLVQGTVLPHLAKILELHPHEPKEHKKNSFFRN